jgi:D-alanyl-D-alanine carboxypeptidase
MKKRGTIFLILITIFLLSGCNNQVQKYTFTQEELGEFESLPKYKIWIGEGYLKLEKKNNAPHLISLDLLRIAFPEYLSDIPEDGVPRYVKAEILTKVPQAQVTVTENIVEIGINKREETENYNYVNLNWEDPLGYIFLVNKSFPLNKDYEDQSLKEIKSPHLQPMYNNMRLSEEALLNLEKMADAFYKDNKLPLILVSTYRDYNHQDRLFTNRIASNRANYGLNYEDAYKKASEIIAIPGTSEHQSGLAIDFSNSSLIQKGRTLVGDFSNEKEGKWLLNRGKDFGFILRYPKDKTDITEIVFEPWHYRYVGYPHSQIIFENNWTLEEYLEYLEVESKYLHKDYDLFYLDSQKIFGDEIYYFDGIKIENDNKGGWILTKLKK